MEKSFNGLRYSSTLGCLVDDNGGKFRMRHSSTEIFLILTQNVNELVSRERLLDRLLDKVPSNGAGSDDTLNECIDSLNECINEIRHVVGNDRLKTIPSVGYLLTSDSSADDKGECDNIRIAASNLGSSRTPSSRTPSMMQQLIFHSQWVTCAFQKRPRAWIGSFFLGAAILYSTMSSPVNATSGHIAYDRADTKLCSGALAKCSTCVPNYWQPSTTHSSTNWLQISGCNPR